MPTDELAEAVNTPGAWGKIRKGGKLALKYGFLFSSLMMPFSAVADPEKGKEVFDDTINLGEKIMSGEVGVGGMTLESIKFLITSLVPFSWSGTDDVWEAIKTSFTGGVEALAEEITDPAPV